MLSSLIVCGFLIAIFITLKPLFHEECPLCGGRRTEHCHLLFPTPYEAYVCHDCHMWFNKKKQK